MKKITPQLASLIAQDPEKIYPVVIVCSPNMEFLETGFTRLMDGVFSGDKRGYEIEQLSLKDEVLSIELDNTIEI